MNQQQLKGKVAIVTGASKGIGAAIAERMAASGAAVVVNYSSSKEEADQVVADIVARDGRAIAVKGDVRNRADVQNLFAAAKKEFGHVDVLVNNAGVFEFAPFEEATDESFRRQYDINVLGTFYGAQEAVKNFGPNGGSIINLSSVVGTHPFPGGLIYSSTKGAIENFTRGLAQELGPKKIRVNAISPGPTVTHGTRDMGLFENGGVDRFVASTPLGRVGEADDIAKVAVFLASEDSAWVSGESLRVAGGLI